MLHSRGENAAAAASEKTICSVVSPAWPPLACERVSLLVCVRVNHSRSRSQWDFPTTSAAALANRLITIGEAWGPDLLYRLQGHTPNYTSWAYDISDDSPMSVQVSLSLSVRLSLSLSLYHLSVFIKRPTPPSFYILSFTSSLYSHTRAVGGT
jgi:hypothetical protein